MKEFDVSCSCSIGSEVVTVDNGSIRTPVCLVPESPHQNTTNSLMAEMKTNYVQKPDIFRKQANTFSPILKQKETR